MPANRSTRTRTSSRKSRTSSQRREPQKGGRKNTKKKQDNTKLFIGIGVGAFFLIFIIIAAASSGGESNSQGTSSMSADFLTISQRKEIYSKYNREYNSIEEDARTKLSNLSMEDRRKNGRTIQKIKGNQQAYLPEKMKNIFEGKYSGITVGYIRKYVIQAGDAQQW